MLKAVGLRRRGAAQADRRRRQHLDRDRSVQLPPARAGRAREGGHPRKPAARRWSSTRSPSPTASRWAATGMRASLISREVIADSIELVGARQLLRRASSRCAAATRRSRARRWRWRGSTCRAWCSTAARSRPGRFHGRDVTIQDVFEARRRARGRQDDRRASCRISRTTPVPAPAPAAASSPPTRWRWPSSSSASRRWAAARCRPCDPAKARRRRGTPAELVMDLLQPQRQPARRSSPARRSRTRSRPCVATRRLHQRRAAPAGDRARGGRAADDRRLRRDQPRACRRWPTSSPAAGSWRPTCIAPAASRLVAQRLLEAGLLHADADSRSRGRTIGEEAARRRRDAGAGGRPAARSIRSRPRAGW